MKHIELLNEDVGYLDTYTNVPCCNTCDYDCTSDCGCDTYVCGADICGCDTYTCGCNVACDDTCLLVNY